MKLCKIVVIVLLVLGIYSYVSAVDQPQDRWGNLIDVSYKFSWYPEKDLQDLLKTKSQEYGMSLEEYCDFLTKELTNGSAETGIISPDSFVIGKDWQEYYRLAVAQFCLFLSSDDEIHLKNARAALSVLSGKMELYSVSFWHFLFQAYSDLEKNDRDAFVNSVFQLWQNVILKLETDDILMMGSKSSKTEFVKNIDFLYENLAHLIITRAIIEKTVPDLYPLGVIIMSIKHKLTSESGYKNILDSLVERMHGLKSDNSNLNFAVAFVEATANQYAFEAEKSASLILSKYNLTRTYYELALSWANTPKGQAAILTQYMGFTSYILRRLIDKDELLTQNAVFNNLPSESNNLVKDAMGLYGQMAQPTVNHRLSITLGFNERRNYNTAMHQLWDSLAKLLMMQSAYYKSVYIPDKPEDLIIAKGPLLQYLAFFKKYAQNNSEIIPDNAFYLAAYASRELSDLYRQASKYSTKIEINDLAFEYQLRAVELFPMDVTGILQLAYQTNQEGRLNSYLREASPVAMRFRSSKVANTWPESHSTDYQNCINIVKDIIPEIIDKAYFLVRFLQQSGGSDSEDELYQKAIVMTRLLMAIRSSYSEEIIEQALTSIAKQDFGNKSVKEVFKHSLPSHLIDAVNSISETGATCRFASLKNELYGSTDSEVHSFLRELYYENLEE